jgi:hypothetical protein
MNSPDDKDPKPDTELAYAPPWIREQAAREQAEREQLAREQAQQEPAPREPALREPMTRDQATPDQAARDQFRATLRQSGATGVEQLGASEPEIRSFSDDRPWRQRTLEPELVPEPPAGTSSLWPLMLRMGFVCTIAAMVAAAVVFLFNPKPVHKIAQASASAPVSASEEAGSPSLETSRDTAVAPASLPALAVEPSAGVAAAPAQGQAAIAAPPQVAAAAPPQLADAAAVAPTPPSAAPAQQIASLPPPNSSADTRSSPAMNEPASRPVDASPAAPEPKPAANPGPAAAPAQAVPQSAPKAVVVLDENEINTLIKRGKSLLSDGDFSGARVLFERAANAGSAEAALALGSTYDPNVISRLGALMVKPDIESARKWYQLAAERGSAAASLQLANLPQRR